MVEVFFMIYSCLLFVVSHYCVSVDFLLVLFFLYHFIYSFLFVFLNLVRGSQVILFVIVHDYRQDLIIHVHCFVGYCVVATIIDCYFLGDLVVCLSHYCYYHLRYCLCYCFYLPPNLHCSFSLVVFLLITWVGNWMFLPLQHWGGFLSRIGNPYFFLCFLYII